MIYIFIEGRRSREVQPLAKEWLLLLVKSSGTVMCSYVEILSIIHIVSNASVITGRMVMIFLCFHGPCRDVVSVV